MACPRHGAPLSRALLAGAHHSRPRLRPQVVPILRAGLVLLEQASLLLPVTQTYHVGYVRNDDTLEVGRACACAWRLDGRDGPTERLGCRAAAAAARMPGCRAAHASCPAARIILAGCSPPHVWPAHLSVPCGPLALAGHKLRCAQAAL